MKIKKEDRLSFALMIVTAALVLATAIIFKQSAFNALPLFISMVVSFLISQANRYAYILGGINSILYTIVYVYYGVYAQALYGILFSFPLQIITFIRWNKHSYKHTTEFRSLTKKQLLFTALSFAVVWAGLYIFLVIIGSNYLFLDITSSLIGILSTILTMLAFIEYAPVLVLSNVLTLALHVMMIKDSPEQITYAIFSVYSVFCSIKAYIFVKKTLKEQKEVLGRK